MSPPPRGFLLMWLEVAPPPREPCGPLPAVLVGPHCLPPQVWLSCLQILSPPSWLRAPWELSKNSILHWQALPSHPNPVVLIRGWFCPSVDIWQHLQTFLVVMLGRGSRAYWLVSGVPGQGCSYTSYGAQDRPTAKIYPVPAASSAEVEKPYLSQESCQVYT